MDGVVAKAEEAVHWWGGGGEFIAVGWGAKVGGGPERGRCESSKHK